jgi:hypothetical protein
MTVSCQAQGQIIGEIQTRPTKTGGQVSYFKMKVTNGNATELWSISSFSDSVREELSGLGDGDSVSVVGAFSAEIYEWKGEQRIGLRLRADRALGMNATKPAKSKAPRTPKSLDKSSSTGGRSIAWKSWAAPTESEGDRGGAPFRPDTDIPFAPEWR